jgi:penicillin-binding protein 1A
LFFRFFLLFVGGLFSWLSVAFFVGCFILGAIFWLYSQELPNHNQLTSYSPPMISRIYSSEGILIDEFARERRLFAPSEEIPVIVKQAFISAEDKNFYNHHGYDPVGILKAIYDAAQGDRLRGASTITQQVMKNFLLSGDRSLERKIKELILASKIEKTLSKDKILELYLNEIFLGQNSYGVVAASQTYFNKMLSELTLAEAAYLAVLPKAPSTYHPVKQNSRAIERRNFVLKEMFENGFVKLEEYQLALLSPLNTVQGGQFSGFRDSLPERSYFTDEIRRELSRNFGEEQFFTGGLTIMATIDKNLQDIAAHSLQSALIKYDRGEGVYHGALGKVTNEDLIKEANWRQALRLFKGPGALTSWSVGVVLAFNNGNAVIGIDDYDSTGVISSSDLNWIREISQETSLKSSTERVLNIGDVIYVIETSNGWSFRQVPKVQGAFMAMDVHSGRILAMQGGFSYKNSVFNRVTQALRQPGSGFKPFVYAAALDSGFSPNTVILDAPIEIDTPQGLWQPKNFANKYFGSAPLRIGIERSRNLMTIRLAKEIGMEKVAEYAQRFGVYEKMNPFLANALGAQETTLYKIVSAYAMFANGGERVEPTLVDRVQDRWGKTVYLHDVRTCDDCDQRKLIEGRSPLISSQRERVMDSVTAYQLTSMMKGVVDRGSAAKYLKLSVPVAGKTGTTNESRDAWFTGFTSDVVAGCYIGFDTPKSLGKFATGGAMCGPVFDKFMREVIKKYGGRDFKVPNGGYFANIDRFSGEVLPDYERGSNVVVEFFRDTYDISRGGAQILDGGFAMGSNLNLNEKESLEIEQTKKVKTSTGKTVIVPKQASSGSLSSGGLY